MRRIGLFLTVLCSLILAGSALALPTIVVDAGMPVHLCPLDERQRPTDFAPGELVSCDVLDGARFTQV